MSRKRFVKMLMSRRVDRNSANALADKARRHGIPYFKALGDFLTLCSIRAFNVCEGRTVVWQTGAANAWVEVLTNA